MIGYIILGTNDLDRAVAYYDKLLTELGASRFIQEDRFVAWATSPDQPVFSVCKPFDGHPATPIQGSRSGVVSWATGPRLFP